MLFVQTGLNQQIFQYNLLKGIKKNLNYLNLTEKNAINVH